MRWVSGGRNKLTTRSRRGGRRRRSAKSWDNKSGAAMPCCVQRCRRPASLGMRTMAAAGCGLLAMKGSGCSRRAVAHVLCMSTAVRGARLAVLRITAINLVRGAGCSTSGRRSVAKNRVPPDVPRYKPKPHHLSTLSATAVLCTLRTTARSGASSKRRARVSPHTDLGALIWQRRR